MVREKRFALASVGGDFEFFAQPGSMRRPSRAHQRQHHRHKVPSIHEAHRGGRGARIATRAIEAEPRGIQLADPRRAALRFAREVPLVKFGAALVTAALAAFSGQLLVDLEQ